MFRSLLNSTHQKQKILAVGFVVPDSQRCVQCGICTYNCPIGIDVRLHSIRGEPVQDSHCLSCGECIKRCPRGVLHFEVDGPLETGFTG